MEHADVIVIRDRDGLEGTAASSQFDQGASRIWVSFDDRQLLVPVEQLTEEEDGCYRLPVRVAHFIEEDEVVNRDTETETAVIPVVAESASVHKVEKVRTVRVSKQVQEEAEAIELPTFSEEIEVQRVPVNRVVDGPVSVRHDGDTMIIPLLEEVLVVEKQLVLKEELHITKRQTEDTHQEQVRLRKEVVTIEYVDAPEDEI